MSYFWDKIEKYDNSENNRKPSEVAGEESVNITRMLVNSQSAIDQDFSLLRFNYSMDLIDWSYIRIESLFSSSLNEDWGDLSGG
jgi:hypothetical protein